MTSYDTPQTVLGSLAFCDDAGRKRRAERLHASMRRWGIHPAFAEFVVDDPGPSAPVHKRDAYDALMRTLADMSAWPARQRGEGAAELRRRVWGEQ